MPDLSRVATRPVAPADAEASADLHIVCWEEAYAGIMPDSVFAERRASRKDHVERWRTIIDSSPASTIVAEYDGELVGFATAGPAREDDSGFSEELWGLYVRAAWWGEGLGHRLLHESLADRPSYLWVLEGNARAIGFYQRQGFALDGRTQFDGDDPHVRMSRPLTP